jgi:hypothetical protein
LETAAADELPARCLFDICCDAANGRYPGMHSQQGPTLSVKRPVAAMRNKFKLPNEKF